MQWPAIWKVAAVFQGRSLAFVDQFDDKPLPFSRIAAFIVAQIEKVANAYAV